MSRQIPSPNPKATMKKRRTKILAIGSAGFFMMNMTRHCLFNNRPYSIVSLDRLRKPNYISKIYEHDKHKFYLADVQDEHITNTICEIENPQTIVFTYDNIPPDSVLDRFEHGVCVTDPYSTYERENISTLILPTLYGPWQRGEKLIPSIVQNVLVDRPTTIYNQGSETRDWMYIDDAILALLQIVDSRAKNTFSLPANQEFSNIEVFQLVCNTLGKGHDLVEFKPAGIYANEGIKPINTDKLDWNRTVKFRDGIKETVDWFVRNRYIFQTYDC